MPGEIEHAQDLNIVIGIRCERLVSGRIAAVMLRQLARPQPFFARDNPRFGQAVDLRFPCHGEINIPIFERALSRVTHPLPAPNERQERRRAVPFVKVRQIVGNVGRNNQLDHDRSRRPLALPLLPFARKPALEIGRAFDDGGRGLRHAAPHRYGLAARVLATLSGERNAAAQRVRQSRRFGTRQSKNAMHAPARFAAAQVLCR